MPPVAARLPALYGSDALLKVLSDEGELSVYLLAQPGVNESRVVKQVPVPGAPTAEAIETDIRCLARMRSPYLAKVLDSLRVDDQLGIVMEHVPGKSLDVVLERVKSGTHLLPPELGLILAHDAFAAVEYFHEFERGSRVHGNLNPRTLMVAYTGEVKVVGYRPGLHPRPEVDAQAGKDVMALAGLLGDVTFRRFPQQLVQALPRLLDGQLSPLELVATAKALVRDHVPTAADRAKVAKWLDETFPGERKQEAKETSRLLAEGRKLVGDRPAKPRLESPADAPAGKTPVEHVVTITQPAAVSSEVAAASGSSGPVSAPVGTSPVPAAATPALRVVAPRTRSSSETERIAEAAPSRSRGVKLAVGGAACLVILVAGLALRSACRGSEQPTAPLTPVTATKVVPVVAVPPPAPMDAGNERGAPPATTAQAPAAAVDPEAELAAAEAAHAAEERAAEGQPAKRREKPAIGRFLRTASTFFDHGKPAEAVKWATRALHAGGGMRAHLALARYLRTLHRHREALAHYRAAHEVDPDNALAAAGVEVLERLQATSP